MHRARKSDVSDIPNPIQNNKRAATLCFGGGGKEGSRKIPTIFRTAKALFVGVVRKENCQTTRSRLSGRWNRELRTPLLSNLAKPWAAGVSGVLSAVWPRLELCVPGSELWQKS